MLVVADGGRYHPSFELEMDAWKVEEGMLKPGNPLNINLQTVQMVDLSYTRTKIYFVYNFYILNNLTRHFERYLITCRDSAQGNVF